MARLPTDGRQAELLPVEHASRHPSRLKNHGHVNPEAIWLRTWQKRMRETPQLLGLILSDELGWDGMRRPVPVTRHDAVICATLVQWLGTAVGGAFVQECQRKVNAAFDQQSLVGVRRAQARGREDGRTPLQRRKDRLDAARRRLAEAAGETDHGPGR